MAATHQAVLDQWESVSPWQKLTIQDVLWGLLVVAGRLCALPRVHGQLRGGDSDRGDFGVDCLGTVLETGPAFLP